MTDPRFFPFPADSPGTSSHEAGLSFDLPPALIDGSRGKQIAEIFNAHGFIQNVEGDRVHFTFAGSWWNEQSNETKSNFIKIMQDNAKRLGLPLTVGDRSQKLADQRNKLKECR